MVPKIAPWVSAPEAWLYHWCPACEALHVIPATGWTRSGPDDAPTYSPSFGQNTKRGYCHYNITNGRLMFHGDSYHTMRGDVDMPDIPIEALERLNGIVGVKTSAVFERNGEKND